MALWTVLLAGQPAANLDVVLQKVRDAYNAQERPMVIFDVDGTLLDNRPRIRKILHEYADEELRRVRPQIAKVIKSLEVAQIRYQITDTFRDAQIDEEAIVNNGAVFWSQRFFTDDYLQYDAPTTGSVDFVRTLYSTGARIVYLSGRDVPRQLLGTVKALRDHGFPIGIQGTELIMKPTSQTQDAIFKQRVTSYLRHYGKVIATFDNEPANCNVYKRAFGDAMVIRFAAPHSPNPPPLLPEVAELAEFQSSP
jgi:hydroxymethylpyrimidine pyrophosphatase-like HAD family hydrolase